MEIALQTDTEVVVQTLINPLTPPTNDAYISLIGQKRMEASRLFREDNVKKAHKKTKKTRRILKSILLILKIRF